VIAGAGRKEICSSCYCRIGEAGIESGAVVGEGVWHWTARTVTQTKERIGEGATAAVVTQ